MRSAIFLAFLFLISCKKLNSEKVFIKNVCEPCKEIVESHLISQDGIYYAKYDIDKASITFHYEKEKVNLEALKWLESEGYVPSADTSLHILPTCCKLDSIEELRIYE